MNSDPSNNDDPLRRTLKEWPVHDPLPSRFRENVWQRITRADKPAAPGAWAAFVHWLEGSIRQPTLAMSYLALLLVVGTTFGYVRAQAFSGQSELQWRAQYVQAVDPYRSPRK